MIFKKHNLLLDPRDDLIIWRYMDLPKFFDLILNSHLFFTNMMNFTDQNEAMLPDATIDEARSQLVQKGFNNDELDIELFCYAKNSGGFMRDLNLVNCWSEGADESYALWKIYVGDKAAGAAIRSTVSRLRSAIQNGDDAYPEDVYLGKVQYRDSISQLEVNRFSLMMTKKTFYGYENEIRAFILHYPRSEGGTQPPYELSIGRYVRVNLSDLIDMIYISPFGGPLARKVTESVLKMINPGLAERITHSKIRDS